MRHRRFIILFFFVLAASSKIKAQEKMQYIFRHISQSDGLLHNLVYSIDQDAKGFIWIDSFNGLQRYDGSRFVYYPDMLSNSYGVFSYTFIAIDKKKNWLWLIKNLQLEKIELDKNKITAKDLVDVTIDPENTVTSYSDAKNGKWYLNDHLIYYSDSNNKKTYYHLFGSLSQYNKAGPIAIDTSNGVKWTITSHNIYALDEKNDSAYSKDYNPYHHPLLNYEFPYASSADEMLYIWIDSRQNIWVITWGNFFYRYDHNTKKIKRYSVAGIKKNEYSYKQETCTINCVLEDDHHNIWMGTSNAGLLRYNYKKDNFDYCIPNKADKSSIEYNYSINSLFQDKEKNIWVGTDKGISIFNPYTQYFNTIRHENNIPSINKNGITSTFQTGNGDIFIGTWGGGISIYDSAFHFRKNILFKGPHELNYVWSIIQPEKNILWFGCQHGYLISYNLATSVFDTMEIKETNHNTIICMAKDSHGNIFMGLNNGNIIKWDKGINKFIKRKDSLVLLPRINNILVDKEDHIWVSAMNCFGRFDPKTMKFSKIWMPDKSNQKAFWGTYVRGIEEYNDSTLIIGTTYGGLNFYNKKTGSFSHLTTANGLPSNNAYAIKKDTLGYVWVTSDYGIYKFIPGTGKFIPYEFQPGVINSSFETASFFSLKDGQWSTFTSTELLHFFPYQIQKSEKTVPPIQITGFKIFNSPLNIDSVLLEGRPLHLSYTENFFTVEFAALNFSNPHQINYYYRLKGVDKNWVNGGSNRFASYTKLWPGEYTFEIKGENGYTMGETTSLTIIISPPFWESWWFVTIGALLVFFIGYTLIKWRIKSYREIDTQKIKVQKLNAEHYKNQLELEQIINYFSSSLIEKNTVNDVIWDVAKNLIGKLGFVDCVIYLWNKDKTKMVQCAGVGSKNSAEMFEDQTFDVLPGQGVVGHVMQSREPVIIADTTLDARYRADNIFGYSEICVPIIYNNELLGIIDSEHHEKNFFTREQLQILNTIATLMATKIRSIEAEQSLLHAQIKMYSIDEQLSNARLEALRSQMNPHFIFNCLNSIDALIHSNDKYNATTYLNKFAKLLRNILDSSRQNTIPFSKDVETLKLYIELEVLRNENKFKPVFNIDEKLLSNNYKVPPLIVQPFVENAILHGLKNKEGNGGILTVDITQVNNKIQYTITDNGIGRKASEKITHNKEAHYGLQITSERIRLFNKEKVAAVHFADLYNNNTPEGTSVTIILNIA